MTFLIECRCGKRLHPGHHLAGKRISCKHCGQRHQVPDEYEVGWSDDVSPSQSLAPFPDWPPEPETEPQSLPAVNEPEPEAIPSAVEEPQPTSRKETVYYVQRVEGGPAYAALKTGDVILAYGGFSIATTEDLRMAIAANQKKDFANVTVRRGGTVYAYSLGTGQLGVHGADVNPAFVPAPDPPSSFGTVKVFGFLFALVGVVALVIGVCMGLADPVQRAVGMLIAPSGLAALISGILMIALADIGVLLHGIFWRNWSNS